MRFFSFNALPSGVFSGAVFSRVMAAIVGGYLLANLAAILLSYILPMQQADAVLTGMLLSFLVYAGAVLWVFAAKTAWLAWIGLMTPSLFSAVLVFFLIPESVL